MSEVDYEYLIIDVTVKNNTDWRMTLTGNNLSWGKWDKSPVDVVSRSQINFICRGREASPSGVDGWVTWGLEEHPINPQITFKFSNPAVGSDKVSISIYPEDNVPTVQVSQTKGNHDFVTITVG